MPTEAKSASQRLSEYFKVAPQLAAVLQSRLNHEAEMLKVGINYRDINWADPVYHSLNASDALTLHPNAQLDGPIRKAFAAAKLDPSNPWHWRVLLHCFSLSHYPQGKRKMWYWKSYWQLLQDADRVIVKHQVSGDTKICEHLRRMNRYKGKNVRHLTKMLGHARDPEKNTLLGAVVHDFLYSIREICREKGVNSDPVVSALKEPAIVEACRRLATSWRVPAKGEPKPPK